MLGVLELGAMSRPDAADSLEKLLIQKELLRDSAAASEWLDELACLPLAIAQAAYLNMNKTPTTRYLWLLWSTEQNIVGLMNREFHDTRYQGSANAVATTWVVSFNLLKARDADTMDLLAFMSCIDCVNKHRLSLLTFPYPDLFDLLMLSNIVLSRRSQVAPFSRNSFTISL